MLLDTNRVRTLLNEIWELTIGRPVTPATQIPPPAADWLVGCVQITGAWRGTVTVAFPADLASRVAARLYSVEDHAATPPQRTEAVGEMVNMLAENLKLLLPPPCYTSRPAVAVGGGFEPPGVARTRVVQVVCEDGGWPLVATVAETHAPPPGKRRLPERPIGSASDSEMSGRYARPPL
jgi:CheY-specific phosphatase CheX